VADAVHPDGTVKLVTAVRTGTVAPLVKVDPTLTLLPGTSTDGADTVVISGPVVRVTANVPDNGNDREESPTRTA
jgi:hypothetical protein